MERRDPQCLAGAARLPARPVERPVRGPADDEARRLAEIGAEDLVTVPRVECPDPIRAARPGRVDPGGQLEGPRGRASWGEIGQPAPATVGAVGLPFGIDARRARFECPVGPGRRPRCAGSIPLVAAAPPTTASRRARPRGSGGRRSRCRSVTVDRSCPPPRCDLHLCRGEMHAGHATIDPAAGAGRPVCHAGGQMQTTRRVVGGVRRSPRPQRLEWKSPPQRPQTPRSAPRADSWTASNRTRPSKR